MTDAQEILELRASTPAIPIIAMSGGGTFHQVDGSTQTITELVARSLAGAS